MSPTPIEAVVLVFVLLCAVGTALLRDVFAALVAFASYSLGISILWVLLRAPDVGLTEAAVGAGVMTLLFLLALANTVRPTESRLFEPIRARSVAAVGAFVLALGATVPSLPAVGSTDAPLFAPEEPTAYYLANAYPETGVHNVVTAVLAAYRGLDTFGEATVVFLAGVATLAVLRREAFP